MTKRTKSEAKHPSKGQAEPIIISREREGLIDLQGVRVNNLKNIDLSIPRGQLVVVTGVSGSGKSSLAFDTLYAEGQRRYVESLSAYARQFLGRMEKPEADKILGIPPAVAIEQRVVSSNARSLVATSTDIYEYLRLLYARVGKMISPESGKEVRKHTVKDLQELHARLPEGATLLILVRLSVPDGRTTAEQLEVQLEQGYTRLWIDGQLVLIEDYLSQGTKGKSPIYLMIDRLKVKHTEEQDSRIGESGELAFFEGKGHCTLVYTTEDGETGREEYSNIFEQDGHTFMEPTPELFSFNNPIGACPVCEGYGKVMGIEEDLVIPNKNLSVYDDAVAAWRGLMSSQFKTLFIQLAGAYDFPIHRPYNELTEAERKLLWEGIPYEGDPYLDNVGIDSYFKMLQRDIHKVQNRVRLSHFKGKTICPSCKGGRLCPDALSVHVGGRRIDEVMAMTLDEAKAFFDSLKLSEHEALIAERLLYEIRSRLEFLQEVGLGYLTLDRESRTLSGGESQRVALTSQLGSSLVGALYVLDEPSIGLHQRDTSRLIGVVKRLRDLGNTVVVVEHDEEMMRASDFIIDIGPDAGRLGGQVVYAGRTEAVDKATPGHTAAYLTGGERIDVPQVRRSWTNYIDVLGARKNNLKGVDVRFPLGVITAVTGVSGSGKSTLIREILYEGLKRRLEGESLDGIACRAIEGSLGQIKRIEYVDQANIAKSSRSNPVIYVGAYDDIRALYSEQALSKQMGYKPYYFSFNKEGGRCERCKGDGYETVEMQFMADMRLVCEECGGKRFRKEILEVEFAGVNIHELLDMTVDEAIDFFTAHQDKSSHARSIIEGLLPLQTVGLGYVKLGQSSSTLSGGESQRVKLAFYLAKGQKTPTLFIFDEPTTGLHLHDIRRLLSAFNLLVEAGHTIMVVEHNLEVIKSSDWVIDLGPEGGSQGGKLVAEGTPEEITQVKQSWTGRYLKPLLTSKGKSKKAK